MNNIYLGLGSNVEDRHSNLLLAIKKLKDDEKSNSQIFFQPDKSKRIDIQVVGNRIPTPTRLDSKINGQIEPGTDNRSLSKINDRELFKKKLEEMLLPIDTNSLISPLESGLHQKKKVEELLPPIDTNSLIV